MPNINPVTEMVDMIAESNSYQADVTAMNTAKTDVREDPGSAQVIPAISGPSGRSARASGASAAVGSLGQDAGDRGDATRQRQRRQLRRRAHQRDRLAREDPGQRHATASQQLATGQLTDPTQAITAVENASLAMDFASQIRNKIDDAATTLFQTQV